MVKHSKNNEEQRQTISRVVTSLFLTLKISTVTPEHPLIMFEVEKGHIPYVCISCNSWDVPSKY
jgi:hypothetical protein